MTNIFTKNWKMPVAKDDDSSSQAGLLNGEVTMESRDRDQRRRWRMGAVLTILNIFISLAAVVTVSFLAKQSQTTNTMQPTGIQDREFQSPFPSPNHQTTPTNAPKKPSSPP